MFKRKLKLGNRGTTIIETLVYVFVLVILSGAVTTTLISLGRSYSSIQSSMAIETAATTALERMVREIRASTEFNAPSSTFNTSPGVLVLNSFDTSSNPLTVRFLVSNSAVRVEENGVDTGPLTTARARVTRLVFIPITTPESEAIKIEMTVEAGQGESYKSRQFYATSLLRGSYVD